MSSSGDYSSGIGTIEVNGLAQGNVTAPASQHPYDFVRTANTWQLWDEGSPSTTPPYQPTLMYETAPGTVGFTPGETLSYWIAIRPTPGHHPGLRGRQYRRSRSRTIDVVLVVTGLIGLLAYAWRKRK